MFFLRLFSAILLTLLLGCATTQGDDRPVFSPNLLNGTKEIALVFMPGKQGTGYSVRQTKVSVGGLIGDTMNDMNEINSNEYTKKVWNLPGYIDLYPEFYRELKQNLAALGINPADAKHTYVSEKFNFNDSSTHGEEWVFYIEGLKIQYFARTLASSYQPRIGAWLVAYNSKTRTLYKPMLLDYAAPDDKYHYPLSSGVTDNPEKSYEGLRQGVNEAARAASKLLVKN
jgi:hypothetical protein